MQLNAADRHEEVVLAEYEFRQILPIEKIFENTDKPRGKMSDFVVSVQLQTNLAILGSIWTQAYADGQCFDLEQSKPGAPMKQGPNSTR